MPYTSMQAQGGPGKLKRRKNSSEGRKQIAALRLQFAKGLLNYNRNYKNVVPLRMFKWYGCLIM